MTMKRQLVKIIKKTSKFFRRNLLFNFKRRLNRLLRTLFINRRRQSAVNSGFVLPTVAMVALVVVLLTTAILFRSFERAKNASNVRVNEVVLQAATPALDRARAKLDALFEDPTLPRGTPTDNALYDALKRDRYNLGDETRLKLGFDIDNNGTIAEPTSSTVLESDETLRTAWKYAVDTDNNGLKDTFTIYGIFFRSPTRDSRTGLFNRKRNPLEARTPPMDNSSTNQACTGATGFASLVGNSSWYRLNSGNLGKSFFVYVVNVPITQQAYDGLADKSGVEPYKGNKSVSALELQQDRNRVPLPNNAVWFENDLEVIVGSTTLLLNGRVHTNGNLLVGVQNSGGNITFRQVSSKTSCFYNQENGQISVGGNVGNGSLSQVNTATSVTVDLYRGYGENVTTKLIDNTNKSTNQSGGASIGFNDTAYNERIAKMKDTAIGLCTSCYATTTTTGSALKTAVDGSGYPIEVKNNVKAKVQDSDDGDTAKNILSDEIEIYLRNRTRRVPYAEVADGGNAISGYTAITASLDPPADWRQPLDSSNRFIGATTVTVSTSQLEATHPNLQRQEGVQTELGDRVFVGNNLPALWLQGGKYVGSDAQQMIGATVNWTRRGSEPPQRWRNTQIQAQSDLGVSDRNGFWEERAAENPTNDLDSVGGVRIITGAGIYVDDPDVSNGNTGPFYDRPTLSFLPNPPDPTPSDNTDIPVWPDTMPMSSPGNNRKGDLLMRATAVYHYKNNFGTNQTPIACVSSYYDPSDEVSSKNKTGLTVPPVPPAITPTTVNLPWNSATGGKSNNGIVYSFPGRSTFTTNKALLERQARLRFPNGRWVNQPLKDALAKIGTGTTVPNTGLQLSDYSAIDTALCAISILGNESGFATSTTDLPKHGAIKEAAFLDAREVKQISLQGTPSTYDLDLEQRQPLEIRVTDIDLDIANNGITRTAITANEFLLPYSGIIYASREDALRDESDLTANSQLLSPTDFKLDPTRRPNGIRLINGGTLARTSTNVYNAKEKGLILVTDLPTYIKGDFNLHRTNTSSTTQIEEFTETETISSPYNSDSFYNRSTRNQSFACRKDRPGCTLSTGDTTGDFWRSATVIADSMTLLSSNFKDGVRSEGDYDLNYNAGLVLEGNFNPATISTVVSPATTSVLSTLDSRRQNRLKNGFWDNAFATSTAWWTGTAASPTPNLTSVGSYTANGVTPIQRRVNAPMYVMEICRKNLISDCVPNDWVVGFDINGDGVLNTTAQNYTVAGSTVSLTESQIKVHQLGQAILASSGANSINSTWWSTAFSSTLPASLLQASPLPSFCTNVAPNVRCNRNIRQRLGAGDTAGQVLQVSDRRYARRVAFARNNSDILIATNATPPLLYQPIGIGCPLDITGNTYTANGCVYGGTSVNVNYGQTGNQALWFRATNSTTNPGDLTAAQISYDKDRPLFYFPPTAADGQPLLVPVLQIHDANNSTSIRGENDEQNPFRDNWIQQAAVTTFNTTFVLGNSPSRPAELSAGLQNFVRFLENWNGVSAKISGSFIQLKRSSFATGPFSAIFQARVSTTPNSTLTDNLSLFDYLLDTYPTPNTNGLLPVYSPPTRNWGFDVALLSEQPDLFAQRFTAPPLGRPNEFFREIGRDDPWVKILLCAGEPIPATPTSYANAVPSEYRPGDCKSIPND
ncbi:MAG TPA: hormogonium polysaccharide biosynthesis protein HpsA [Leptolyngbyaceae cyanobacterium]